MSGDPLGYLYVVLAGGARLRKDPAEEWQEPLLVRGEDREVDPQVHIGDAVGRHRIEVDRHPADVDAPALDRVELHGDVAEIERRQYREVLLGVLLGLEAKRIRDDPLLVRLGQ